MPIGADELQAIANLFGIAIEEYMVKPDGFHAAKMFNNTSKNIASKILYKPHNFSSTKTPRIAILLSNFNPASNAYIYASLQLNTTYQWVVSSSYGLEHAPSKDFNECYVVPKNAVLAKDIHLDKLKFTICHYVDNQLKQTIVQKAYIKNKLVYVLEPSNELKSTKSALVS